MLLTIKPKKISLYLANGRYSAQEVRNITGADIVINGTLYTFKTMKPCLDFKANGTVYSDEEPLYEGYGWNNNSKVMSRTTDMAHYDNFISSCNIIKDKKLCSTDGITWVTGSRPRTAIGWKTNGEMVIYITNANKTIAEVSNDMLNAGCYDAINLDGGGSSQLSSVNYGKITSAEGRKVQNYICIWEEAAQNGPTTPYTSVPAGLWAQTPTNITHFPIVVRGDRALNVRQSPNSSSRLVRTIPKGTTFSAYGYAGSWLVIDNGYVFRTYTECDNPYVPPKLDIQRGSFGEGVYWMQWQLGKRGFVGVNGKVLGCDGNFGPNTEFALKSFQEKNGLKVTGVCNAETREKLKK